MPHGTSRELYKGILGDAIARRLPRPRDRAARRPEASDARAVEPEPPALRRRGVDTKPQLEIHADDVKCSHGSSIGQLDEDALFYLRSRGILERDARDLLTPGFAREILDACPCRPSPTSSQRGAPGRVIAAARSRREPQRRAPFDVERVRKDFPILSQRIHGKPLVFLDSAASAQKPEAVIDAVVRCSTRTTTRTSTAASTSSPSARRGGTRARARRWRASSAPREAREIVFVRNTTEAINLVASDLGRENVGIRATRSSSPTWSTTRTSCPGRCCARRRARTAARRAHRRPRPAPLLDEFEKLLSPRTKLVAPSPTSRTPSAPSTR